MQFQKCSVSLLNERVGNKIKWFYKMCCSGAVSSGCMKSSSLNSYVDDMNTAYLIK